MRRDQLEASGIPLDLEERAVETLGTHLSSIEAFVRNASMIPWLARVDRFESWDSEVHRIRNLEAALDAERAFEPVSDRVWEAIETLGRSAGRFHQMQAAEHYWIVRHEVPDEYSAVYDRLLPQFSADQVGAMRELILEDLVAIQFYRQRMEWYERGHWLCAIELESGRPIIY